MLPRLTEATGEAAALPRVADRIGDYTAEDIKQINDSLNVDTSNLTEEYSLNNLLQLLAEKYFPVWDNYLFKLGEKYTNITGGWSNTGWTMTGNDYSFTPGTFVGTTMHFEGTALLKGQLLAINNLIDITNYTALKINVTDITLFSGCGAIFVMKGKIIDKSYGIIQEFDKTGIHEVNISGLNGDYYIGITVYNNASRTASVNNVWLE